MARQPSIKEGLSSPSQLDTTNQYPWQFFRDNHTPKYVVCNYHPDCLDNEKYFIGRDVTKLNLTGFIVSIVKYARESDIKKAINGQFADVLPHVRISLTKLRRYIYYNIPILGSFIKGVWFISVYDIGTYNEPCVTHYIGS